VIGLVVMALLILTGMFVIFCSLAHMDMARFREQGRVRARRESGDLAAARVESSRLR
jgi:hypothetical protein